MAETNEKTDPEDEELLSGQSVFKGPRLKRWFSRGDS